MGSKNPGIQAPSVAAPPWHPQKPIQKVILDISKTCRLLAGIPGQASKINIPPPTRSNISECNQDIQLGMGPLYVCIFCLEVLPSCGPNYFRGGGSLNSCAGVVCKVGGGKEEMSKIPTVGHVVLPDSFLCCSRHYHYHPKAVTSCIPVACICSVGSGNMQLGSKAMNFTCASSIPGSGLQAASGRTSAWDPGPLVTLFFQANHTCC